MDDIECLKLIHGMMTSHVKQELKQTESRRFEVHVCE